MEKRILLVEDDAQFRETFTRALRLALATENPEFHQSLTLRGLKSLPVKF